MSLVGPLSQLPSTFRKALSAFWRREDGTLTTATAIWMIPVLVVGGACIDFMHHESERVLLQDCLDKAALAAANISYTEDPDDVRDVTMSWLNSGGCDHRLVGEPDIADSGHTRSVVVTARDRIRTHFLKLIGKDRLALNARSAAQNSVQNVEISLVLDISGSMNWGGRFARMQEAASRFATTVLDQNGSNRVSLNVIPYAGQVNPGAAMFEYLGAQRLSDDYQNYPLVSSCIEMGPGAPGGDNDFRRAGLPNATRTEAPHFMYWNINWSVMDWGWCPQESAAIQYAQVSAGSASEAGSLLHWIANLRMHDGTGTHYGMKYALALLDPSSQGAFAHLNDAGLVPDQFANRPLPYEDGGTRKIIVLMTDGNITEQVRPKDPLDPENATVALGNRSWDREWISSAAQNVESFESVCNLAKSSDRNVVIYTVAFEAPAAAQQQLGRCATSSSTYFNTTGDELIEAFDSIARTVYDLRLTN